MAVDGQDLLAEADWVRAGFASLQRHQIGSYVNFLDHDDHARVRSAYGETGYERLMGVKQRYDPDDTFRLNPNIGPR